MAEVTRVRVELQEQNGRLQAELTAQEALKEKVAALERQLKGELGPEPPAPSRRGSADRWPGCRAERCLVVWDLWDVWDPVGSGSLPAPHQASTWTSSPCPPLQ